MAKVAITDRSDQALIMYNRLRKLGNVALGQDDRGGLVQAFPFEYTNNTGSTIAAGSYIELCQLGRGRVVSLRVTSSALGASRTLNIGTQEYVDMQGNTIAPAATAFMNAADVSSAVTLGATSSGSNVTGAGVVLKGSAMVLAQVNGGTIPAGATIKGIFEVVST